MYTSGHPKNVFLQNKGFKEKPGGKAEPCPREDFEEDHFWKKVFVSKMTHNLVFAGQQRRTATLPELWQEAWLEACSC